MTQSDSAVNPSQGRFAKKRSAFIERQIGREWDIRIFLDQGFAADDASHDRVEGKCGGTCKVPAMVQESRDSIAEIRIIGAGDVTIAPNQRLR